MRGWAQLLVVAVPFTMGATTQAASAQPDHEVLAHFTDPTLTEASGLVVAGDRWVTVNDSGNAGDLFVVDPATGATERKVPFTDDPVDVEALALEGDTVVWVGDIGDNRKKRSHLSLYRVPLDGRGSEQVMRVPVRYPDGPHDAESLVRHPVTGELFVLTKGIFGGGVYRAPAGLAQNYGDGDVTWTLEKIPGGVPSLATDAAFTPDGRHLLVRGYGSLTVLSWPGLQQVARQSLPQQRQGEALAVQPDGAVVLASEGIDAPVLRIPNPVPGSSAGPDQTPGPSPTAGGTSSAAPGQAPATTTTTAPAPVRGRWESIATWGAGALALALAAVLVVRRARRR